LKYHPTKKGPPQNAANGIGYIIVRVGTARGKRQSLQYFGNSAEEKTQKQGIISAFVPEMGKKLLLVKTLHAQYHQDKKHERMNKLIARKKRTGSKIAAGHAYQSKYDKQPQQGWEVEQNKLPPTSPRVTLYASVGRISDL
jgi:hypothetical protein